jgi:hypothetical protein
MFNVKVIRREHDTRWKRILAHSFRGTHVKVGFPAGEVSSDLVMRAIWNEFGTRGGASGGGWGGPIPERPFMRNAMRANRGKYQRAMSAGAREIFKSGTSLSTILSRLGILAQGDIQGEITSLASPPNSPVTIKLKGSSNPLIDSGEMRAAVTWKIED